MENRNMSEAIVVENNKALKKSIIAGSIGVFVHWFDWAIYAYLSATIAQVFFPEQSGAAGLMAVFGVLALSFAVRPIGALIFGHFGDKVGRTKTLTIVILAMAAGTLMVGVIPGYATIGIWAPILLVVARIIQGLAAGGEYGSAAAFMAEYSPTKHRGFGVSWIEVGSLLGFLVAALVVYILSISISDEALIDWGWRLPFILSAPFGVIGFYIRLHIEDTPEFQSLEEMESVASSPIKDVFRYSRKETVQAGVIEAMMNVTFYIVLVYLLVYQESILGWSASKAALLSSVAAIVAIIIVPLAGAWSDKVGRKPLLIGAAVSLILFSYPLFLIMGMDAPWAGTVSTIGLGIILAVILGVHAVTCAELFPTRTRQSGMSISYQVGTALFAGTAPYIITWLIAETNNQFIPAYYLIGMGVIGLLTVLKIPETAGIDLLAKDREMLNK